MKRRRREGEIIARATAENSGGGAERGEGGQRGEAHASDTALLLSIKN